LSFLGWLLRTLARLNSIGGIMGIAEIIFGTGFITLFLGCWFFMHGVARTFWLSTFGVIVAAVIASEAIAVATYGQSISQMFWSFSLDHPGRAWIIIVMLGGAFVLLLWHLATKMLKKGD